MTELQAKLLATFPDEVWLFDEPLAPLTYAKIGGKAECLVRLHTPSSAASILRFCHSAQVHCTILGGASNVLISDDGLPGVVLQYADDTVKIIDESMHNTKTVFVGSGTKTALAVSKTVEMGLTGLEYFLGVPGTIGGAIFNNAHYLSELLDQYISRVQVVTPDGDERRYSHDECEFAYEHSRFQTSGELILGAEFQLLQGNSADSQEKIAHATRYRAKTQPLGMPSSGCMFRNPPNTDELKKRFPQFADATYIPAGFLIDQAGLKGKKVGNVSVSEKHAAWILNHGGGTSSDVAALVEIIKDTVRTQFGVQLETEVFFLHESQNK